MLHYPHEDYLEDMRDNEPDEVETFPGDVQDMINEICDDEELKEIIDLADKTFYHKHP